MKKNFMCFIYVYFWNRKMDNPVWCCIEASRARRLKCTQEQLSI